MPAAGAREQASGQVGSVYAASPRLVQPTQGPADPRSHRAKVLPCQGRSPSQSWAECCWANVLNKRATGKLDDSDFGLPWHWATAALGYCGTGLRRHWATAARCARQRYRNSVAPDRRVVFLQHPSNCIQNPGRRKNPVQPKPVIAEFLLNLDSHNRQDPASHRSLAITTPPPRRPVQYAELKSTPKNRTPAGCCSIHPKRWCGITKRGLPQLRVKTRTQNLKNLGIAGPLAPPPSLKAPIAQDTQRSGTRRVKRESK